MGYDEAIEWALNRACHNWRYNQSCDHDACRKAAEVARILQAAQQAQQKEVEQRHKQAA